MPLVEPKKLLRVSSMDVTKAARKSKTGNRRKKRITVLAHPESKADRLGTSDLLKYSVRTVEHSGPPKCFSLPLASSSYYLNRDWKALPCTCSHPLHLRHLRLFQRFGLTRLTLLFNSRKQHQLQPLTRPGSGELRHTLLIHIDGVIANIEPTNSVEISSCYLRPGAIDGLKFLGKTFSLIYLSAYHPKRFERILSYMRLHKVPIDGAYWIKGTDSEERGVDHWSFQDYSSVYEDLGISTEPSARILAISALRTELEKGQNPELYSVCGTRTQLHARHLPVVLPHECSPVVTLLLPHLNLEGRNFSMRFTVAAREVFRLYRAAKSNRWDEGFASLQDTEHVRLLRTKKVHEAYYAYLLPVLHSEDTAPTPELKHTVSDCLAHPSAAHNSKLIRESRVVVVTAPDEAAFACCAVIYSEPVKQRAKAMTLLEYTTCSDI
jgi:hypothetical protein